MKVAEHLLLTSQFYADVCFHSQQASEKALKAFLVYHRITPKKTHQLNELLRECAKIDNSLGELSDYLDKLNKFYIPTRYPFKVVFTHLQAEESIRIAKHVVEMIKNKIK